MDINRWRNSIYYTIMDIVKAFNTNDLHTEIAIKGTIDDPLFRASDVGVVLDMVNIRATIVDFDDSEKRAVKVVDSTLCKRRGHRGTFGSPTNKRES